MSASQRWEESALATSGAWTVSQVHAGLDAAIATAGMGQLWVVGTVGSLRRTKGGFLSLELVEYQRDATRCGRSCL